MATLSSMLWLTPAELISAGVVLERDLLITPVTSGNDDVLPVPIPQWREGIGGLVGLPVAYGLRVWGQRELTENLCDGKRIQVPRLPNPLHPKASPGQGQFFDDVFNAVTTEYAVLAEAPTGSGKTVTVLNTIGRLQRSAVVVVPSNYLADQWHKEAKLHLGLRDDQIGRIGGGVEDWQDKALVVVVLHNLFLKEYPREFYHSFGFAAWDEAHNLGAREFSKTMHLFPAAYKVAVSATPDRKDGCAAIFTNQFGEVRVRSRQRALDITCYTVPFYHKQIPGHLKYCNNNTKALMWLATCERRNTLLVEQACSLYDKGYQFLVLSKYISHVELLIAAMVQAGIPAGDIGQFTGKRTAQHTFKSGPRAGQTVTRMSKVTQQELDNIKANSQVIAGTYSMLKEGVDIPRIDAGLEAMPMADGRQAIGRARRPFPGKAPAIWLSVEDLKLPTGSGTEFLYGYTAARLRGYRETGVRVVSLAA